MNGSNLRTLRRAFFATLLLAVSPSVVANCAAPGINTLYSVVRVSGAHGVVARGVVIGPGQVLTAAHIIDAGAALQVTRIGEQPRSAQLMSIDVETDLALLAADTSGMNAVAISAGALSSGDPVWAAGYPRNGDLTMSSGHYQTDRNGRVQSNTYIDSGQSGGALFSCRHGHHELAGIVHGFLAMGRGDALTNTGESVAVAATTVRRFLGDSGQQVAQN